MVMRVRATFLLALIRSRYKRWPIHCGRFLGKRSTTLMYPLKPPKKRCLIETAGALSEGLGDYTTDDLEKLTGHRANSYETFARDFSQAFGGSA